MLGDAAVPAERNVEDVDVLKIKESKLLSPGAPPGAEDAENDCPCVREANGVGVELPCEKCLDRGKRSARGTGDATVELVCIVPGPSHPQAEVRCSSANRAPPRDAEEEEGAETDNVKDGKWKGVSTVLN